MTRKGDWRNSDASTFVRVVRRRSLDDDLAPSRWKHSRAMPGLWECLAYPLADGPGLGLLVLFPPLLWFLSLPVFDFIAVMEPLNKSDWALGLLVAPVFVPMLFSFAMTFGYLLLFLGRVLVASALGENDHPRWPEWSPADIAEGIGRWIWAGLMGLAVASPIVALCWDHFDRIDWVSGSAVVVLIVLAAGFTQMALAASLMLETIAAANPVMVVRAISRIGWAYLIPTIVAAVVSAGTALGVYGLLFHLPTMWMEALALWGFWVFLLYGWMVVMRMMGLTYHAHAMELFWFRRRPRWASGGRSGRIYANS